MPETSGSTSAPGRGAVRRRAEIEGIVQGVGFRPFVYGLAARFELAGFVRNTSCGVDLEVEGPPDRIEAFFAALKSEGPPLARITGLTLSPVEPGGEPGFSIIHSRAQTTRSALISPDVAVCDDCLREMMDPADRRYRYPFINCTNCGPRYTIIMDVPYDRDKTSMAIFDMCPDCSAEYHDPANRRFHAQPNACPVCGPHVSLLDDAGWRMPFDDPIEVAADFLAKGLVLAIKGLGGFHLAVDAYNNVAVNRLRQRKRREEKPLAVMAPTLDHIRDFAHVSEVEADLLLSRQRPIVLLNKKEPFPLAESVAPDNKYIGAMLPYTPLHYLLLEDFGALVMTSGNLTEEPICIDNDEAELRLGGIADFFLVHNRDIYLRADDSVVRAAGRGLRHVRRSRGFAPEPIFLGRDLPPVLAVGAELKNTVCLAHGDRAFVSQHVGDLENVSTLEFFELTVRHLQRILEIRPQAVAYDLHPEYLSTKWALDRTGPPVIGVQHHHAHAAAVMAEHHLKGPVVALCCDGTGYGEDRAVWGGEVLIADYASYQRFGHLDYLPLPGGAAAIREPWRMAASYLVSAFGPQGLKLDLPLLERQDLGALGLLQQVIDRKVASPPTSSLGRLFDAASALIGLKDKAAFEGQAAMMLEMICPENLPEPYRFDMAEENGRLIIKHQPLIRDLVDDIRQGADPSRMSGRFHAAVIRMLTEAAVRAARVAGIETVVLGGGCFQNMIIIDRLTRALTGRGLAVYTGQQLPVNDGGLSLGQAVVAGARMKA